MCAADALLIGLAFISTTTLLAALMHVADVSQRARRAGAHRSRMAMGLSNGSRGVMGWLRLLRLSQANDDQQVGTAGYRCRVALIGMLVHRVWFKGCGSKSQA